MTERDERTPGSSPATKEGPSDQPQGGVLRWLIETALLVGLAFLLATGIRTYIVQPFIIPTGSMIPTIQIGDRVIAEKISYRFRDPKPGEIVVFDDPYHQNPQLIKRVIAVGGQTVDIRDGHVFVDGKELVEPYVHGLPTTEGVGPKAIQFPLTVPKGQVLLLGDNRPNSGDGRYFGPQPLSAIRGRAFVTYWPIPSWGMLPESPPQTVR